MLTLLLVQLLLYCIKPIKELLIGLLYVTYFFLLLGYLILQIIYIIREPRYGFIFYGFNHVLYYTKKTVSVICLRLSTVDLFFYLI